MLQIAEPGFHQHAPFGATRHDTRRGLAGAAATMADGSEAGRPHGRCSAAAARERRARSAPPDARTP
ncbi:hypothetical protein WR31_19120 [Burkholderia contaminans LMG 23361]|uniref:Uncharacterized protein n=1 Tax=Burkholderia contaminans LMG 23361 TaxID=1334628 RepID=A0ABD4ARN9_9BURK|nr:hypothetical protein WR31_19120 [Burkholderia contaminans LMG 23361]